MNHLPAAARAMTTGNIRPGVTNAYSSHYETVDRPANPKGKGYAVSKGASTRCKCGAMVYVRSMNQFGQCKECVLSLGDRK